MEKIKKLEVIVFAMEVSQMYCHREQEEKNREVVLWMVKTVIMLLSQYKLNTEKNKRFNHQFNYYMSNMRSCMPEGHNFNDLPNQKKMLNIFLNTKEMLQKGENVSFDLIMRTVAIITELYLSSFTDIHNKKIKFFNKADRESLQLFNQSNAVSKYYQKSVEYLSRTDYSIHCKAKQISEIIEQLR